MSLPVLSSFSTPASIAPSGSGFGWTGVTDDYGFRISKVQNALVAAGISFEASVLGAVITMDSVTRTETVHSLDDLDYADFNLDDLDDWYVTFQGDRFQFRLDGDVDQSAGVEAMTLKGTLTMAPAYAATNIFRGFRLTFTIDPASLGGTTSTCRIMVPGVEEELWAWTDSRLGSGGRRWAIPGSIFAGGEDSSDDFGDTGHLPYDDPSPIGELGFDTPAFVPEIALFDNTSSDPTQNKGVCFRLANHSNGGAVICKLERNVSNQIVVTYTFFAQDCSIGTDGNSDTAFTHGLQIHPMVGDDFDAQDWTRDREIAESWAWAANGKIAANSNLSDLAANVIILGYASGATNLGSFEEYHTSFKRVYDRFELGNNDMAVQVYSFSAQDPGTHAPLAAPFKLDSASIIQIMFDDDLNPILYTDVAEPTIQGLDVGLDFYNRLTRTRLGYTIGGTDYGDQRISGEGPAEGIGSDEGDVHYAPTYLNPTANAAYLDMAEAEHDELNGKKRGNYDDTRGGRGSQSNDDYRLNPADRGPGATTFIPAERAFVTLERTRMTAAGITDPALFTEFVNPYNTVGVADLAYSNPIYPPGSEFYGQTCLGPARKYGAYIALGSYLVWPGPPTSEFASFQVDDWADYVELFNASTLRWFMAQIAAPFQMLFTTTRTKGWVRTSGEAGYDEYVANEPFYTFVEDLYVRQKALVKTLHRSARRLRELSSSMTTRANNYKINGTNPQVAAGKVGSGCWYLSGSDEIVAVYGNWSRVGGHPVTVSVSDTLTTTTHPELGSSARDAWLLNFRDSTLLPLQAKSAGTSYTIELEVPAGFVGAVFLTPDGVAPTFGVDSTDETVAWTGDIQSPLAWTGEI